MRNPIEVLDNLTSKAQDQAYKFQRLYRNLYNPDFYWLAYKNIYANKGSMTAGVDGTTLSGLSERRIGNIIASLKDHSYKPQPARREYIEKKGNAKKKRPLGIQSANDKLVQEIVRMILERIFEPKFSNKSHGFRPERSCHTALVQIQNTFTAVNWFVEGDIEKCFDSFDHHILIELLRQRIDDETFISLMWKFLKAGYMEQWDYNPTYDGVPQGSGISPTLSNIYLSELDQFMEGYKGRFDTGNGRRARNPEYTRIEGTIQRRRNKLEKNRSIMTEAEILELTSEIKTLSVNLRKTNPKVALDTGYKRVQYVRYADDFIIGVIGSRDDAEQVKSDVKGFLGEKLKLTLSDTKTQVTHSGDKARFLGYDISVSREQSTKRRSDGVLQRVYTGRVILSVPREKWVSKLREYKAIKIQKDADGKERFKALHRGKLINKEDIDILSVVNAEIRGLYNYYCIANDAFNIGKFANLMKYSMLKTFANKYRTKVSKIKARYIRNGNFTVDYQTKGGEKTSILYNGGFARKDEAIRDASISVPPRFIKYNGANSLARRIKAKLCELCGVKTDDVAFHQVKKLKDLEGSSDWERKMLDIRRKTLVMCPLCYEGIHS